MFNIAKIFSGKPAKMGFTHQELADFLKTSPEALEAFERSYANNVSDEIPESDNIFDINSRQAKEVLDKQNDITAVDDVIDRIVDELLAQAISYTYDGENATVQTRKALPEHKAITAEEIQQIPEELRPQLSGNLMHVDVSDKSSSVLLLEYSEYLKAKKTNDMAKARMMYNHFRQGLDILDLDPICYEMLSQNQNAMGNWLPQLVDAVKKQDFFKIPRTTVVKIPMTLLQLTRNDFEMLTQTTKTIVDRFCTKAFHLDEGKEYFVKTGTFSSKYDFRNAHVKGEKEVKELGEYLLFIHWQALQMASPLAKPTIYGVSTTNEWVVREFIRDKENNPCIYEGMPLHTEYRVFVDFDMDEILGINPYWDPAVMKKRFEQEEDSQKAKNVHDAIIYRMHEETLMKRYNENKEVVLKHIKDILPDVNLEGQWSVDVMQNGDEFYIIDMALAQSSALKECVPAGRLHSTSENWIPKIEG